MCGIAGIRRFEADAPPIRKTTLSVLAVQLQHRGLNATGIALQRGDEIHVMKADVGAWEFVKAPKFDAFCEEHLHEDTQTALVHVRAATKGDPSENENNHPVWDGNCAIIHNGMISNDDTLFREMKLDRKAEVDSDIIRAILDKNGLTAKGVNAMNKMWGTAALAAISVKQPDKLLLARSGNPLVIASVPGQILWASEKNALHLALRPWFMRYGMYLQASRVPGDGCGFTTMNDHSAWLFGPKGREWHAEFNPSGSYNPRVYHEHDEYRRRRGRFKYPDAEGEVDCVVCPNPECGRVMWLDDETKKLELNKLKCLRCQTNLAGAQNPDQKQLGDGK